MVPGALTSGWNASAARASPADRLRWALIEQGIDPEPLGRIDDAIEPGTVWVRASPPTPLMVIAATAHRRGITVWSRPWARGGRRSMLFALRDAL